MAVTSGKSAARGVSARQGLAFLPAKRLDDTLGVCDEGGALPAVVGRELVVAARGGGERGTSGAYVGMAEGTEMFIKRRVRPRVLLCIN